MAKRFEYFNSGDDGQIDAEDEWWLAQTFTPQVSHFLNSVRLKLFRALLPGTLTVSIKRTEATGKPSGLDLTTGSINGNTLTNVSPGLWYEIALSSFLLAAKTKYAIVIRALLGDADNKVNWRLDQTSPAYSRGAFLYSSNSGSSWTLDAGIDFLFEEWGIAPRLMAQQAVRRHPRCVLLRSK